MFTFRLIDLIVLTAMVAVIYALRQVFDPGTVLLLGFLPGAVFATRVMARSANPDLFLRMFSRCKQAAAGGITSAVLLALLFFSTLEGESVRRQPAQILVISFVFGVCGAVGGFVFGALLSAGEEANARLRNPPAVNSVTDFGDLSEAEPERCDAERE